MDIPIEYRNMGYPFIIVYGLESGAHGETKTFYFDVWIALLSTLAGMVNVVTLLLFFHANNAFYWKYYAICLSFNEEEMGTILHLLGMILCFSGGGVLSGFLFSKKNLNRQNGMEYY